MGIFPQKDLYPAENVFLWWRMTEWLPDVNIIEIKEGRLYAYSGKRDLLRRPLREQTVTVKISGPAKGEILQSEGAIEKLSIYTLPSLCEYSEEPAVSYRGRPWGKIIGKPAKEQFLMCMYRGERR
jgi:hypothetical protein